MISIIQDLYHITMYLIWGEKHGVSKGVVLCLNKNKILKYHKYLNYYQLELSL